ncbi:hypothetical protein L195_g020599, partial [Trifolium pratense]
VCKLTLQSCGLEAESLLAVGQLGNTYLLHGELKLKIKDRSLSHDSSRTSPYPKWEEARCPVCMEHPHNTVLLICSSHEKGCCPYMCNTGYRHSNCLDQFCKSFAEPSPPTNTIPQV